MATPAQATPWTSSGILKIPGLPAPTGQYNVGGVDIMAENGLLVRLYYPTHVHHSDGYQFVQCIPDRHYSKATFEIYNFKPAWLLSLLSTKLVDARGPALDQAPFYVAKEGKEPLGKLPVIVFSHGLHAHRSIYSYVCCDRASHGYIVAAVEHKDRSASITFNRVPGPGVAEGDYDKYINEWVPVDLQPNESLPLRKEQVNQRRSEVSKALDLLHSLNSGEVKNMLGGTFDLSQFVGHLDTDKAAVMGHSFGGATTVVTLASDDRFKCGIGLDTWMFPVGDEVYSTGVNQPLLFINSFTFQWAKNITDMMKLVTLPDESGIARCSLVTLKDSSHYTQSDGCFVFPSFVNTRFSNPNDYEANKANSELCTAFMKRHLLKDPDYQTQVPLLDGGEGSNDLVLYGTNVEWKQQSGLEEDATNSSDNAELGNPDDVKNDEEPGTE